MFDEMPFLNNVKRAIIYRNKKLTIGELIANFNSKTHWDKNSYYFMINNCQNRITNIIICLQPELLDEQDIINKIYKL